MKDNWRKLGKEVSRDGTIISYINPETMYVIESRKRPIPHANRSGTWNYTSYFVLKDGQELAEKHSLRDAKEYAERLANGEDQSNRKEAGRTGRTYDMDQQYAEELTADR